MDKMTIANMSLGMFGGKLLKSDTFLDSTPEGKQIRLFYDAVRQEILCEHPWSFATKRFVLTRLTGTPVMTDDAMTVMYSLPPDYLKMVALSDVSATFRIESGADLVPPVAKILLSNVANLKIKYVFDNDDPTAYFPKFTSAFATKLASMICFQTSESLKKAEALAQKYLQIDLPSAMSEDSGESTQDVAIADEWLLARFRSGEDIVAPPGSMTWHFVFQ